VAARGLGGGRVAVVSSAAVVVMNAAPADSLDENQLRIRDDLISRWGNAVR
jgi:hypothetical protein